MKKNNILTVPNLLSLLRLIMIPQLMWLYLEKQDYVWTVILLVLLCVAMMFVSMVLYFQRNWNTIKDSRKGGSVNA